MKVRTAWPLMVVLWAVATTAAACSPSGGGQTASSSASSAPSSSVSTAGRSGSGGLPIGSSSAPIPPPNTCRLARHDGQPLPDPACTPGAVNPAVSRATVTTTICTPGWTKTVRPPTSVTNRIKRQLDLAYGLAATTRGELDHLVSLELGGAPDDPRNLWVEPGSIPNPKDAVENKLHDAVCSGLVTLGTAQRVIAADWMTALDVAGLQIAGGKVCLRDQPTRCAHRAS